MSERPQSLSPEEIAAYRRDGYLVPRYRLEPARVLQLRAALDQLLADNPGVRPEQLISAHIRRGPENIVGNDTFFDFACDSAILDMVEQIIGPDIILWGCQMFCKPAGEGRPVPWHQDARYWPIRPPATVSVWVAIDDSTPENGCLRVVPGSHTGRGAYRHRTDNSPELALDLVIEDGEIDLSTARNVVLSAGQMSLHDVYLVHGSNANRSPRRRAGLALRYMPTTSHFDREMYPPRTLANGLVVNYRDRPIWLLRGVDRSGRNDVTVGREG